MADAEEINVDELLSEVEKPSPERGMTGEPEAAPKEAEPPSWDGKAWEFESNGKKIFPDSQDKAKIWMSQGYNYSQRMGDLNKTHAQKMAEAQAAYQKAQEMEKRFSPYTRVDEYVKQNPQWWAHVTKQFEESQNKASGVDPNLQNVIKPLEEKIGQFEQFFSAYQQEQQAKKDGEQDQALDQEVEAIRKAHPTIDLNALDQETGETLELRILKHAQKIGTGSFKVAYRDYLHDVLMEQAKSSGREAIAKDVQVNAKKGIIGKTQAPVKGIQPAGNVRGKSYNQLASEALAEFGIK